MMSCDVSVACCLVQPHVSVSISLAHGVDASQEKLGRDAGTVQSYINIVQKAQTPRLSALGQFTCKFGHIGS